MSRRVPALLLLIVMSVATGFGQQNPTAKPPTTPPGQEETIRVSTAAVQIEAIVTDKSGRRINGLSSADFQLTDEGVPQRIDFFSVIEGSRVVRSENRAGAAAVGSGEAKTPAPISPLTTPYRGRHIVLVFDDLNLSPENFLRSRGAFADYINAKLSSSDMVALVSTGGSLESLQQFTNDKQRLLSALSRIASQSTLSAKVGKPRFNMTAAEAVRIDSGDTITLQAVKRRISTEESAVPAGTMADEAARQRGSGRMEPDADVLDGQVRATAKAMVSQISQATRINLKTLENLFRGMADLPGRKIIVLVTESLITAGASSGDVSNELIQLIELARRSGVSVYALDAAGLHANNTTASEYTTGTGLNLRTITQELSFSDFENLGAARVLVAGTGGELIANTNNLAGGLDRAIEDSSTYYVVGFKPAVLDNKFHRLAVSIRSKPDLVVRSRRGYLAVNQETVRGTNTELAAALISLAPHIDLPLEVIANVVPKGSEQIIIPGLHVGRNYLSLPEPTVGDQTAAYEVLAWVFAAGRDQPVGIIKRTVTYDLAKDPEARKKLKANGFVFVPAEPLTLPAGAYQIRAVVREKMTGLLGTGYQFFEVPDLGNTKIPSMSSVLLIPAGQMGFNGTNSFKSGTEVDVRFVIYNLPKDASTLEQRIIMVDEHGRTLIYATLPINGASSTQAQAMQATRISVPTERGRYAVIVTLTGPKGKIGVERRADFVVE